MQRNIINQGLSVSGQLAVNDLARLEAEGVRSIINNRPDGESDGQPTSDELESAARALGIGYRYIPVTPGQWRQETIDAFSAALRELPAPVHAFCRSGMRSTGMWALQACAAGASVTGVMQQARQAGYDLSGIYDHLVGAGEPS